MQTSWIDFSGCEELISDLDGNSQKTRIVYRGEDYILKFGETVIAPGNSLEGSYRHTPVSEWIGCHLFAELGIPAQETLIGEYDGREVVACKDFVIPLGPDKTLVQFRSLENMVISSSERGRSPRLADLEKIFDTHPFFSNTDSRQAAKDRYWDTFVGDAIIGNFDRHAGNWGYIAEVDPIKRIPKRMCGLAPVFDCGSSMAPKLSEEAMLEIAEDEASLKERALTFPKARLIVNGTANVGYLDLMMSPEGVPAREALIKLAPKIASLDIAGLTAALPEISEARQVFYAETIRSRIKYIIQPAFDKACSERGLARQNIVPELDGSRSAPRVGGKPLQAMSQTAKEPRKWQDIKSHVSNLGTAPATGGIQPPKRGL